VVQRIVKAALQNAPAPYSDEELAQIAARCNEQESNAQKVERTMRKVAAASLFSDRVGQTFKAVVTGASEKGVWVRTFAPPVEGRVVEGERGLDVGERVLVKLVDTDIERGFIDFVRVN
jgi:exoribonuclease-2